MRRGKTRSRAAASRLASGLALVDPAPNMAIAFNAAPGTVAPDEQGPYGAYATSLTEMIAAGGLSLDDIFARLRLRVSDLTQGAEVPWYASQIDGPFFMTERVGRCAAAAEHDAGRRYPQQADAGFRQSPTMPMRRRSRSTRSPAMSNSSAFIRTVLIRSASPRCWRSAAKRLSGAAA